MLRIQARAKINWTLDICAKRPDGYHELDMLMHSVALADTLTVEPADELTLEVGRGGRVPADGANLALRAANALREATGVQKGARLWLGKRIPVAAGMGGGSADAAAVLVGLNRLWGCGLSEAELERSVRETASFCPAVRSIQDVSISRRGRACRVEFTAVLHTGETVEVSQDV